MTAASPSTILATHTLWQILSTPPMSGIDNMAYDQATLNRMQKDDQPPVLRFFRFNRPTLTYGKHQSASAIPSPLRSEWDMVQRPTGGGWVQHQDDLCLSLCWRAGQSPLPSRLKDHYAWIHQVILNALHESNDWRLANCRDCSTSSPFETRACFTNPVAYDVLNGSQKIVGGALCRQKNAFLYQGSIQAEKASTLQSRLEFAFRRALQIS